MAAAAAIIARARVAPGDFLGEMHAEPNAEAAADSVTAEIACLVPTGCAPFGIVRNGVRH